MNHGILPAAAQGPLVSEPQWPVLQTHGVVSAPKKSPAPSQGGEIGFSHNPPLNLPVSFVERCHTQGTATSHQTFGLLSRRREEGTSVPRWPKEKGGVHRSPEGGATL